MSLSSARRLFAGVAAAGAFVAATALPAYAAPDFHVLAHDTLVAPGSNTSDYVFVSTLNDENSTPPEQISLVIDTSDIGGAHISVESASFDWDCDSETGPVFRCQARTVDEGGAFFNYQTYGNSEAEPGSKGTVTFTAEVDGVKGTAKSVVTIGEGVDLATPETISATAEPGAVATANQPVGNIGTSTVHKTILNLSPDWRAPYRGDFSNCTTYGDDFFVVCTFDQDLEPGQSYQLSQAIPYKVEAGSRTGAVFHSYSMWLTQGDWDMIVDSWITDDLEAKPGKGEPLRIVPVANARRGVPQTDVDGYNNFSSVNIKVGGDNRADVAAVGASAAGAVGATVTVKPAIKNLGPAFLEQLANEEIPPVVRIKVPTGTTAVEVGYECAPYTEDGNWPDWEAFGQPGAAEYGCLTFDVEKGTSYEYAMSLRIDKVIADATGAISVNVDEDPNAANNVAEIVINGTGTGGGNGGTGGGDGDGGGLPVTGPQATLIATIGVLLLGGGAAGFVLARRRRTRFVA
jgi:LPXTG-motif cell wall-anchored protein